MYSLTNASYREKKMNDFGREKYELRDAMVKRYEVVLASGKDVVILKKMVAEILGCQKEDGSFSVIDNYRCPSDIRVDFVYFPTYYATAALIFADRNLAAGLNEKEKEALLKGLKFATGRQLVGSGYEATKQLIKTLRLYAKAGMYEWIYENGQEAPEFSNVVYEHFHSFVIGVARNRTFSDWNENFREQFLVEIQDYEDKCKPGVWYVAYGSNLSMERFMKYINRCSDTTPPAASKEYRFGYDIYFAKKSSIWKGGVAFLDNSKEGDTMGRRYLISQSQFKEIMEMEGSNYDKKILLGMDDGKPIYTFTASHIDTDIKVPSEAYLDTILQGLKEIHPEMGEMSLELYLYTRGFFTEDDLALLGCIRRSPHAISLKQLQATTQIPKTRVQKAIHNLKLCGLIVQDNRSAGVSIRDMEAMVYCKKEKRELIDVLMVLEARY